MKLGAGAFILKRGSRLTREKQSRSRFYFSPPSPSARRWAAYSPGCNPTSHPRGRQTVPPGGGSQKAQRVGPWRSLRLGQWLGKGTPQQCDPAAESCVHRVRLAQAKVQSASPCLGTHGVSSCLVPGQPGADPKSNPSDVTKHQPQSHLNPVPTPKFILLHIPYSSSCFQSRV